MDCPSCGHPNATGARFCGECGTSLSESLSCPECGASNPSGQRFCNSCGHELAPKPAETEAGSGTGPPEHLAEKIRRVGGSLEGERKQVTVLFADVMGSMELAENSDPELWQRTMDRFFAILSEGVHAFEGTVDKFTGDGIMALFGAPIAHEDHARRACFAALRLIDDLSEFSAELRRSQGINFLARIGINSGEVVVGSIGEDLGMEYTAVGHTVGLAQRMESLAEPGKAYLAESTAELVQGYLELKDLGEFEVKGASQPLRVHELTGVGPARGRLDISEARGFSKFVGREDEMKVLEAAFERATEGEGQVIGIVGEAGVGKSRLCHEFAQRWRAKGFPVYQTAAQAHATAVPLMPVMELMRAYFDITDQDSAQRARERIAGKLLLLDEQLVGELPLIFDFLGVPDAERPPPRMDAEARARQLLAVVKRLIRAQSSRQPGINLFEDLHWIDPASEAFLANHVDAVQGTHSLTILNFRPEYQARWMSKTYYRQIPLVPLSSEAIAEMLEDQLGADRSLEGLPELLNERTGGNPFFIEEVMQALVEAGNLEGERGAYRLVRPVEESVVPASVQVVLAARIDRLPEREKGVLQAASVIGKEFPQPVLDPVAGLDPNELEEALRCLVSAGFVYELEIYPEAVFAFKHPLTQEVAYGSQLGGPRASAHAAAARAIEGLYPEKADERAALLAHHWEQAGEALEAARSHARAAVWTGTRDPVATIGHWRRVAELADALPEDAETLGLRLSARMFMLQFAWRVGISAEEADALFREGEEIAAKSGDLHSRAFLLSVYAGVLGITQGKARAMAETGARALSLAEESGDPVLYINVCGVSYAYFLTGDDERAVAILDRALELTGGDTSMGAGLVLGCPYGYGLIFKGGILSSAGRLEEGRRLIDQGIEMCGEFDDLETTGWGHMWHSWNAYWAGEPDRELTHAKRALEIAERIGDSFSRAWSRTFYGAAQVHQGLWDEAAETLEGSLALAKERGTAFDSRDWSLYWLAQARLGQGGRQRALELVEEGIGLSSEMPPAGAFGNLMLARVLLSGGDPSDHDRVEEALGAAVEGAYAAAVPLVHVEEAELARQLGDAARRARSLGEAHRLFEVIGATGRAERLAVELEALPG